MTATKPTKMKYSLFSYSGNLIANFRSMPRALAAHARYEGTNKPVPSVVLKLA